MILAAVVGLGLQLFAGLDNAVLPALLVGMFVAMLVPTKTACRIDLARRDH
ncbi:MAG: hypothetical protein KDE27_18405 [Planctomycetes bacterium]|nr:hypothetical protein [Planctomycetota bacterium]